MSTTRGVIIAFGVLGLGFLAVGGITASKMSGNIGVEGGYDMPPSQVQSFIQTAATRSDWKANSSGMESSLRHPGEQQLFYTTPLLPWMIGHVAVKFWPEKSGTHVMISGNGDQVKALKAELDNRLPALGTP
ncbi:MAG: hypothetical protein QM758_28925 [Armatimonas sp.]